MKTRFAASRALSALLALLLAETSYATPPAAPVVTVGAGLNGDLSLSRDGRFLAVGSAGDDAVGTGARCPPLGLQRTVLI